MQVKEANFSLPKNVGQVTWYGKQSKYQGIVGNAAKRNAC